jgi:hypothetical protein
MERMSTERDNFGRARATSTIAPREDQTPENLDNVYYR